MSEARRPWTMTKEMKTLSHCRTYSSLHEGLLATAEQL